MDCSTPAPLSFPLSLGICSNSCPLSRWCHPTISSSVTPFFCPQSFSASGYLPMSRLFTSGGQSICNITSVLSPSLSLTLLGGSPRWSPSPPCVSGGQSLVGTVDSVLLQGDPQLMERPQCPALPFPPRITEVPLAGKALMDWVKWQLWISNSLSHWEYQLNSHTSVLQGRRELDGGHLAFSFNYFVTLDTHLELEMLLQFFSLRKY